MYKYISAEFHSKIGLQLYCPLCFSPTLQYLYELRDKLSSALIPTKAIPVKSGLLRISLSVIICGAVLCTLQHHRVTVAGGPNLFQVSSGSYTDLAVTKSMSCTLQYSFTLLTTS